MSEPDNRSKKEQMKDLFPEAVRDDGTLDCDQIKRELKEDDAECQGDAGKTAACTPDLDRDKMLERLKLLFPDAVKEGKVDWKKVRKVLNSSGKVPDQNQKLQDLKTNFPSAFTSGKVDLEQIKYELGDSVVEGEGEFESAENDLLPSRFSSWGNTEREANRIIVLISGVVVGFLFNALIRSDSGMETSPPLEWPLIALASVSAALLAFAALFIVLVIYAIDSYVLQRKTFAHLRSTLKWRDTPSLPIRWTAKVFMCIQYLPEAEGDDKFNIQVRRGGHKENGRVMLGKLNSKSYRVSRIAFLLGIAGSAAFFILLAVM